MLPPPRADWLLLVPGGRSAASDTATTAQEDGISEIEAVA